MPGYVKGATSQSIDLFIQQAADGSPFEGLAFNTSGLVCEYRRGGQGASTAVTLATLADNEAAWSSGGFVEIEDMVGLYRFDIPNAILDTGVDWSTLQLYGADGMAPCSVRLDLLDPLNVNAGVVESSLKQVNGDATAAANLAKTTRSIGRGTVGSGSSTSSIVTSAFAPNGASANQFLGRVITFDADTTTTALRGQSTIITASSNDAAPTFTVETLSAAPVSGDTFSVT